MNAALCDHGATSLNRRLWIPLLGASLLAAVSAPFPTHAQESIERKVPIETGDHLAKDAFPVDDNNPENSVPTPEQAMRRPLQMGYFVMLLIERGDAAMVRGDHKAAIKYYRALVKAIPERSRSHNLLCKAYAASGDIASALPVCRQALGAAGVTLEDNLRFVELTLKQPGTLPAKEVEDVEAVIAHLEQELGKPKGDDAGVSDAGAGAEGPGETTLAGAAAQAPLFAAQLRCDLATRLEDVGRLESCTAKLRELAPKDAKTAVFSWVLALKKRDFAEAERLIAKAKADGLPPAAIAKMEARIAAERAQQEPKASSLRTWGLIGSVVAALAVALTGLLLAHRRRTLRAA